MPDPTLSLDQALRAQKALRDLAGLPQETFPIPAFVGMISDEIDALRQRGHSDSEIVSVIRSQSSIDINESDITANYAPPEARHPSAD